MKDYLIFGIFMFIYKRKRTSAKEIAEYFEISTRSVYRYIDALCLAQIPVFMERGKNGGIGIMPEFRLENQDFLRKRTY